MSVKVVTQLHPNEVAEVLANKVASIPDIPENQLEISRWMLILCHLCNVINFRWLPVSYFDMEKIDEIMSFPPERWATTTSEEVIQLFKDEAEKVGRDREEIWLAMAGFWSWLHRDW